MVPTGRSGCLTKGLRRARGLGPRLDERNRIAEAIREHLRLVGWRMEPGPGIGGHSQLLGPGDNPDGAGTP
jgi:hypothetical protein